MLELSEIKDLMGNYGFTESMRYMKGDDVQSIDFLSKEEVHAGHVITPSYMCTVTLGNGNFKFFYAVSKSTNKLETPDCSPVTNEKHFERIRSKFEKAVRALYQAFE